MNVVTERVLAWKRNEFALHPSGTNEELAILVETLKGFAELVDIGGRDGITAHDIAEIQKRRQAYDDRSRDMSCDSTEVYLCDIATE